jgi:uncharacterized membrane protein YraQ (UPF0718 family)
VNGQLQIPDVIMLFASIFYEALPFIILGSIISGVLEHVVPQQAITRIVPKFRPLAIAMSCLLGLVFPMCECGIVPVMRRLLRKGLPLSCCVSYMMAGPILNPVVLLSTYVAFKAYDEDGSYVGTAIICARAVLAFVIAFTTGLIVDRQYKRFGNDLLTPNTRPDAAGADHVHESPKTLAGKIAGISETALSDFVDITVFLTLGAVLSAIMRMQFTPDQIEHFGMSYPIVAILAMMGLAIILCLCSEADAFVAASYSSLAPAPKIAFLVLGPMLDIKLFILFTRVFRYRVIWTIVISVIVQTFVYCLALHYILPTLIASPPAATPK